jgi:hypothetical protein
MNEKPKLLGGQLIPGTADYAVAAMRNACSLAPPHQDERSWKMIRAMAQPLVQPGKRIWYTNEQVNLFLHGVRDFMARVSA